MQKTINTTDLRTMHTERKVEQSTSVEQWVEQGTAPLTGVGLVCARGRRCLERFEDGTVWAWRGGPAPNSGPREVGEDIVL